MKVMLFGGNGFIGTSLSEALVKAGYDVSVFDRPGQKRIAEAGIGEQIKWYDGDFLNPVDISKVLDGIDVVFHLVSSTLPQSSNENPAYDLETNVVPSIHLIEAAKKAGVRKLVFISSGGTVYGIPKTIPIPEDHPTDPICAYGISKLSIEKYLFLARHNHDLDSIVFRLANPYGRYQNPKAAQGAIAVFLHKAMKGETIEIWGDGKVIRDYVYMDDVVEAMLRVLKYKGKERIFNLGSGVGSSLIDIIDVIESLTGKNIKCRYLDGRSLDVPVNVLDIGQIQKEMNWVPRTTLREGVSELFNQIKVAAS